MGIRPKNIIVVLPSSGISEYIGSIVENLFWGKNLQSTQKYRIWATFHIFPQKSPNLKKLGSFQTITLSFYFLITVTESNTTLFFLGLIKFKKIYLIEIYLYHQSHLLERKNIKTLVWYLQDIYVVPSWLQGFMERVGKLCSVGLAQFKAIMAEGYKSAKSML